MVRTLSVVHELWNVALFEFNITNIINLTLKKLTINLTNVIGVTVFLNCDRKLKEIITRGTH